MIRRPPRSTLFPYTTLFRSRTTISLRLDRDGTIEARTGVGEQGGGQHTLIQRIVAATLGVDPATVGVRRLSTDGPQDRSEEHTSELQSLTNLVCRLLLEKKN